MGNVWFTSDPHYRHEKVITFGNHRPFKSIQEHDEELRAKHNALVRPHDLVWFLGDVWFGRDSNEMVKWFNTLNGEKRLIAGNHDTLDTATYLGAFTQIRGVWPKYGFVMSHAPLHPDSVDRWGLNVHGHTHDKKVTGSYRTYAATNEGIKCITPPDSRYYCVSVEQHNLAPVPLDTIRKNCDALRNNTGQKTDDVV